jgi:hypothetical protein
MPLSTPTTLDAHLRLEHAVLEYNLQLPSCHSSSVALLL